MTFKRLSQSKHSMRRGAAALLPLFSLALAESVWAEGADVESGIFLHNDSFVGLSTNGSNIELRYIRPRWELEEAGVKKGTVLFDGKRDGDKITGRAYRFSRNCAPIGYNVSGTANRGRGTIELEGIAPRRDAACRITRTAKETLAFGYAMAGPPYATPKVQRVTIDGSFRELLLGDPFYAFDVLLRAQPANWEEAANSIMSNPGSSIAVSFCFYGVDDLRPSNDGKSLFIDALRNLVERYSVVRSELALLGYPETVWQSKLDGIRDAYIEYIVLMKDNSGGEFGYEIPPPIGEAIERLIDALDKYRLASPRFHMQVEIQSICGGDFWGSFNLISDPPNASITVVSEFDYKWCQAVGLDPEGERCDMWRHVFPNSTLTFGTYRYKIEWEDGTVLKDSIDVGDANDDNKTFTVRKPKK